ncbi:MAG: acyl-CoA dehydrogenase family protein [Pseudomonadales bacterium]|nr:acyl-CoA dehydrogenase family protein [Pseudomonadales bacterium]
MDKLKLFRQETRAWLEENCPQSMRTPMPEDESVWGGRNPEFKNPESKIWMDNMAARGWTTPSWPKEYGGGGLNRKEDRILKEEMSRLGCRNPLMSFGIWMLGPVLLEYGTDEQKQEFIPKIIKGEIRWCQGYSEPGAGSDLASLATSAIDKGDHFLVNGQKIWTSFANKADWIFCLVRTSTETKHGGISFLLFDMTSPGVETRPIKLISGSSPFCETFITDVKVPKDQLMGPLNEGWTIAKKLLQHERTMISEMGLGSGGASKGQTMGQKAKEYIGEESDGQHKGKLADPILRGQIAEHEIKGKAFSLTLRRAMEEAKAGSSVDATASMFKLYGTEHNKSRYELYMKIFGHQALGWEGEGFSSKELDVTRQWLRSKGNSIEGGTSEVQLNIISKRVLGLPS